MSFWACNSNENDYHLHYDFTPSGLREARLSSNSTQNLEELQAELIYLVTRYSCEPGGSLASAVTIQLQKLLRHPLIDVCPALRQQCAVSLAVWRKRSGFLSMTERPQTVTLQQTG